MLLLTESYMLLFLFNIFNTFWMFITKVHSLLALNNICQGRNQSHCRFLILSLSLVWYRCLCVVYTHTQDLDTINTICVCLLLVKPED